MEVKNIIQKAVGGHMRLHDELVEKLLQDYFFALYGSMEVYTVDMRSLLESKADCFEFYKYPNNHIAFVSTITNEVIFEVGIDIGERLESGTLWWKEYWREVDV